MTTDAQNSELLEEFRHYLEQSRTEDFSGAEYPDLQTLLGEMAGLKTEVKSESRQFKNTLDSLSQALDTLRQDNKALSAELGRHSELLERQRHDTRRTLLLELVDIYERLVTSVEVLDNYQPVNALFRHSKPKDIRFIEGIREGQSITLKRFEQLLLRYRVKAIDCVGKPLDPKTMNAVAIAHDPLMQNGIVLEQLRPGFLFEDEVLRLAEVKVNKIHSPVKTL
ncbi:nucleotide exchange factor GrpE [Methylomarinum sp. Ch1-1]|uniref:Protein GrpE n=1 Tax=Methylomarinum roseum TaxID=3067653 RepID=A0AAU7NQJ9_9GAMM|nr:nucleotide exchange factor GrpE [Methylomarinum sp. Ch1-1]MDP4520818.1 nucleotide exchange factor GrpE [Methylomarinum sp. Ch1-1]